MIALISFFIVFAMVITLNHFGIMRMARDIDTHRMEHEVSLFVIGNSEANAILKNSTHVQHIWEGGAHLLQRYQQAKLVEKYLLGHGTISNLNPVELMIDRQCALTEQSILLHENALLASDFGRYMNRAFVVKGFAAKLQPLKTVIKHYLYFGRSTITRLNSHMKHYLPNGAQTNRRVIQDDFERYDMWIDPRWRKCALVKDPESILAANLAFLGWLQEYIEYRGSDLRIIITPLHPVFRESANNALGRLPTKNKQTLQTLIDGLKDAGFDVSDYKDYFDDRVDLFNNGNHLTDEGEAIFSKILRANSSI